jgi:hypothetical protein
MPVICPRNMLWKYPIEAFPRPTLAELDNTSLWQDREWVIAYVLPYTVRALEQVDHHHLEQFRWLPVECLTPLEPSHEKFHKKIVLYAERMQAGSLPPPILVMQMQDYSEMGIINGHHRWLAAQRAGWTHIPCWVSWAWAKPLGGMLHATALTYEELTARMHRRRQQVRAIRTGSQGGL